MCGWHLKGLWLEMSGGISERDGIISAIGGYCILHRLQLCQLDPAGANDVHGTLVETKEKSKSTGDSVYAAVCADALRRRMARADRAPRAEMHGLKQIGPLQRRAASTPELFERRIAQGRVAHCVFYRFVAQVGLNASGIVSGGS
jgi:hypothetical protein